MQNRSPQAVAFVVAAACAAALPAIAGDPAPAVQGAVEVRLAAKPGETFRFRQTESSSLEVDGRQQKGGDTTQVFAVKVKSARADGGLDVEVTFEEIRAKHVRGGRTVEFDTTKEADAAAGPETRMLAALSRAMCGATFTVSLDAHGAPTAVAGLREAVAKGLASTPYAAEIPLDKIFGEADSLKLATEIFVSAPPTAVAPGAKSSYDVQDEVAGTSLDFAVETTLAEASADTATFSSKLTWKPSEQAKAGGSRPEGGGERTAKFSRKDGFVLSMKKRLDANRETPQVKATSHSDMTVERLAAAPEKR